MYEYKIGNTMSLSEQAKEKIKNYINSMDLQKSNKLPREEKLAEIIGVSRVTIRTALNDLAAEGKIFRRQGKGTFVNTDSFGIKVTFSPIVEFTQMIRECGYTPSVKILNVSEQPLEDEEIIKGLGLPKGEPMVLVEKVFFADKTPCSYTVDIFAKSILEDTKISELLTNSKSIFEVIFENHHKQILWDRIDLDVVNASKIPNYKRYLSSYFEKDMPLLLLNGLNFDNEDKPIMYSHEYIDTSIIKFSLIRQRKIQYIK